MKSPAVCDACGELGEFNAIDHFELLGFERQYDLAESALRERYLPLARLTHPDRFAGADSGDVKRGLALSARLNEAYETLRDPIRRAEYMLHLVGGASSAEERTVPQEVLMETLMLREEIDEARQAGHTATLAALREQVRTGFDAALVQVLAAARGLSTDPFSKQDLRLRLNAIKYYQRMLEQFDA